MFARASAITPFFYTLSGTPIGGGRVASADQPVPIVGPEPQNDMTVMRGLYLIGVGLIAIACMEVAIRVVRPMPPLPNTREIGWNADRSPYRLVKTVDQNFLHKTQEEVNQLRLRGRPFPPNSPDQVRVLLVGDSNVEAGALPFRHMPEVQLEEALNRVFGGSRFAVRSIASSGWGQDQQLLALRSYFQQFSADYILLWHEPANDYWENAFLDRSTGDALGPLKPTFVLGADGLKQFDYGPYIDYGPLRALLSQSHFYRALVRLTERAGVPIGSPLLRDFNKLIPGATGHRPVSRHSCPGTVVQQYVYSRNRPDYGDAPVSIDTDEALSASRSHFTPFLKEMSDRDRYLLSVTRALFQEIRRLGRQHNSETIIFVDHQGFRDVKDRLAPGSCVTQLGKWYQIADRWERVRDALAQEDLIELRAIHASTAFDEVTVSQSDRHFNELGNRLALEELATRLKTKLTLKRNASAVNAQLQ
jgi:hypothetical protein